MKFPSRLVFFFIIAFVIIIVIVGSLASIYQLLTKQQYTDSLIAKNTHRYTEKHISFIKKEDNANINYNFVLN